MSTVGSVNVILSAESSKLVRGFKDATQSLDGFQKQAGALNGGIGGLSSTLTRFGLTAAPIAAVGAAFKIAFSEAARIDDIADATGLAAGQIMKLESAALAAGVSTDGITQAIQKMNITVGQAISGNEEAAKKFERLGLSMDGLQKMSTIERFQAVGAAIGKIGDRSQQAAFSSEILGKSSAKIVEMFSSGTMGDMMINDGDVDRMNRAVGALNNLSDRSAAGWNNLKMWTTEKIGIAVEWWSSKLTGIPMQYDNIGKSSENVLGIQKKINALTEEQYKKQGEEATTKGQLDAIKKREKQGIDLIEARKKSDESASEHRISLMSAENKEAQRFIKEESEYRKSVMDNSYRLFDEDYARIETMREQHKQRMNTIVRSEAKEASKIASDAMAFTMEPYLAAKKANEEKRQEDSKDFNFVTGKKLSYEKAEADAAANAKKRKQESLEATRAQIEIGQAYAGSIQNISNMMDQMGEKTLAAFYIDKAAKMASALVNTWVGYTAAMTIPPPAGQILAGTTLASGMMAVGMISAQQPQGRASGGPVSSGSMYEVNERGPELLSVGDRTYLMMGGKDGHVTPNSGAGGPGGGNVTVNVINSAPSTSARVEQSSDGNSLNVIIEQVEQSIASGVRRGDSPTARAIQSSYGLGRRGQ